MEYKIGDKIDYLTLIALGKKNTHQAFICRCICGKISKRKKIDTNRTALSCGCKRIESIKKGQNSPGWKGIGEIPKAYFDAIKCSARYRKKSFNITQQYIWNLFLKQNRKCQYTNIELKFSGQRAISHGIEQTASLDRINNNIGYEEGNLAWCHKSINKMKHDYTKKDFIQLCRIITKNKIETPITLIPAQDIETQPIIIEKFPDKLEPGLKINHITLLERIQIPNKNSYRNCWKYQCDCGKIGIRREDNLKPKINISCGCISGFAQGTAKNNKKWTGYKDISGLYLWDLKNKAKRRKLSWEITEQELWKLFLKQGKKCPYLNEELTFASAAEKRNGLKQTASLDRIDSSKGYIIDNIQWIHKRVQMMKKDLSESEFLKWCELVSNHQSTEPTPRQSPTRFPE